MSREAAGGARPGPPGREQFRHWARIPLRYTDLDTLGHVNNVAYAAYLEQARCELIYPIVAAAGAGPLDILIAHIAIDYLAEVNYPGTVDVGTSVTRIGTKSFRLVHAIFTEGSKRASTTGETTCVWFDLPRRITVVPPAGVLDALRQFMIEA